MNAGHIIQLAVAAALIVGGIIAYRRGGTQGGVALMLIGALLLVHGLGLINAGALVAKAGQ